MAREIPNSCVAFTGGMPLFASEEGLDTGEVELALSGQYKTRNFELGRSHFEEMAKNHAASGVDPAVDREHESWFGGSAATPALGWVKSLDVKTSHADNRRVALVGKLDLNDLGKEAVKGRHYRYVSIGFDKAGKNRRTGESLGHVLDHVALVKKPFIEGMRPLSLALSANLGRPVEGEDPMELLSTKLRTVLGLAADAPEEQIVIALEAREKKTAADAEALAAKVAEKEAALTEQKSALGRVMGEVERLSKDAEKRDAAEWVSRVKLAVGDFKLTPAEGAEYEKLSGAERAVAEKLLSLRAANKPAPEVKTEALRSVDGRKKAQDEALAAHKIANPGIDEAQAFMACALEKPELFADHEGV